MPKRKDEPSQWKLGQLEASLDEFRQLKTEYSQKLTSVQQMFKIGLEISVPIYLKRRALIYTLQENVSKRYFIMISFWVTSMAKLGIPSPHPGAI